MKKSAPNREKIGNRRALWVSQNGNPNFRDEKNSINMNFLFRIPAPGPADIPDPYAQMPSGQKVSPPTGDTGKRTFRCGRPRFSARPSMTQRVVEKLCTEKVCVDFQAPILATLSAC